MKTGSEELRYVKELTNGSHEAYNYLFIRYHAKVHYYIDYLVMSPEAAKDLTQDIFTKIWINREQMGSIESFDTWIYRVAKNAALNYLKQLEIRSRYELGQQGLEDKETIEETIEMRDMERVIWAVVENMPPQRKKIFKLSRKQYLKNTEIMNMLNISEKTVKNHLFLALKSLKKYLIALRVTT